MRNPRAVPNLCKADSGLSAMIGILVAISSHLVAHYWILIYAALRLLTDEPRCYTSEGLYRTTLVLVTGHLPQPTRHPKLPNLARGALT